VFCAAFFQPKRASCPGIRASLDPGADTLDLQRVDQAACGAGDFWHGTAVSSDDRHAELEGFKDR